MERVCDSGILPDSQAAASRQAVTSLKGRGWETGSCLMGCPCHGWSERGMVRLDFKVPLTWRAPRLKTVPASVGLDRLPCPFAPPGVASPEGTWLASERDRGLAEPGDKSEPKSVAPGDEGRRGVCRRRARGPVRRELIRWMKRLRLLCGSGGFDTGDTVAGARKANTWSKLHQHTL